MSQIKVTLLFLAVLNTVLGYKGNSPGFYMHDIPTYFVNDDIYNLVSSTQLTPDYGLLNSSNLLGKATRTLNADILQPDIVGYQKIPYSDENVSFKEGLIMIKESCQALGVVATKYVNWAKGSPKVNNSQPGYRCEYPIFTYAEKDLHHYSEDVVTSFLIQVELCAKESTYTTNFFFVSSKPGRLLSKPLNEGCAYSLFAPIKRLPFPENMEG
ncbi:hypothetical protein AX774_g2242 [Zancudomyces culisetae]|uniref:Uncharacterized protein n=1 Tax=Zancudomyces culisetae TaxID=1213189 RepID=A0A1R1PTC2_ZANCU|nr:hypothetical protein AX774_g2242 [Zancudomyces culisetae]|eukprot:OMH84245.1 hypothetical protein AX774_g2242 [Zancudomyces culisetae]